MCRAGTRDRSRSDVGLMADGSDRSAHIIIIMYICNVPLRLKILLHRYCEFDMVVSSVI